MPGVKKKGGYIIVIIKSSSVYVIDIFEAKV